MKRTNKISKEQQLKDYNTVANFLMSGDSKEVKEFAEQLNWGKFTYDTCKFMSIDFIRKYKDYIDWGCLCHNRELSEDFIREFADYVSWYFISLSQNISDEFRAEFKEYLEGIE